MAPSCRCSCLLLMLPLVAALVHGFVPAASSSHIAQWRSAHRQHRSSTHGLKAVQGDKGGVDDLLESPAFLKKKIEVLEKQIAKTEVDIVAANAEADKVS
jgi:hypothetical protein